MTILLILLVSLLSCAGQLCQKQAAQCRLGDNTGAMLRWLVTGMALLGIAMLVWLAVLRRVPVSLAYPMLSLNFVFVALAARIIWREPLTLRQFIGTLIIMVGVALMGSHL
ncbi:4-amino-4-deoxy-L-arabinose-phosphoundecaprenol flippase subunit ArnE [Atlantibacter sp.]|uniref:4-amino-4-deoxy-L-arabinose-phosphoundecaprenol flippase subunit ArnE n=1 Tax=Atlantibacter sp. TaxID=1903473 RepID=UPI0028B07B51|nr:4-amino-4-deoxy-L-arabinose-phosphoundecaprenol flippase subunit ArnE [Atlantibacter sp.]